ncbi:hypothetical protein HZS_7917 [Henneguya salminicola]|nr:hypothetical protein HZS_7917 [Henneguya salminicola]
MIRKRINLPLTILPDAAHRQLNILSRSSNIYFDSTFKSVPEIFLPVLGYLPRIPPCINFMCFFALMERKTEIMCRRFWERVRENVEITCRTAMCNFEKASINSFMFCNLSTLLTGFFFTSANLYGAAFKVVGNQHYTEVMKQRDQSLSVENIGRTCVPQYGFE